MSVEHVNLVDPQGTLLRSGVERHPDGQYGQGIHMEIITAVVFNSLGQLVVQRRGNQPGKRMPGFLDIVCGAIKTYVDLPPAIRQWRAASREIEEETTLILEASNLRIVDSRVNANNYFRHLLVGMSDDEPGVPPGSAGEVAWVGHAYPDELRQREAGGQDQLVPGLLDDLALAERALQVGQ